MPSQTPTTTVALNPLAVLQRDILGERMTQQLEAVLPDHVSVKKFQRVVMTAVNKDESLLAADRRSFFVACVECAQDGLVPNGKEAALVIFSTKDKTTDQWRKKVQYMPMILGIFKRARNSGEISMLNAHLVHENDEYDYQLGFEPDIAHRPAKTARGKIISVYAVAILKDGTRELEVMTVEEVEAVRATSKTSTKGPWVAWWGEMARKTVVRRLAKRLPMSAGVERMINSVDAMYPHGETPPAITTGTAGIAPPRPTKGEFIETPEENPLEAEDSEPWDDDLAAKSAALAGQRPQGDGGQQ